MWPFNSTYKHGQPPDQPHCPFQGPYLLILYWWNVGGAAPDNNTWSVFENQGKISDLFVTIFSLKNAAFSKSSFFGHRLEISWHFLGQFGPPPRLISPSLSLVQKWSSKPATFPSLVLYPLWKLIISAFFPPSWPSPPTWHTPSTWVSASSMYVDFPSHEYK